MIDLLQGGSVPLYQFVIKGLMKQPPETLTLLDLCCGETNHIRDMQWKRAVHVDLIDEPRRLREWPFVQGDALAYAKAQPDKAFDVVLCSDGVEHFPKAQSLELMAEMPRVGRMALIFTPYGPFGNVCPEKVDDPHIHKCFWTDEDLGALGWRTLNFPNWHGRGVGAFFACKGEL